MDDATISTLCCLFAAWFPIVSHAGKRVKWAGTARKMRDKTESITNPVIVVSADQKGGQTSRSLLPEYLTTTVATVQAAITTSCCVG